MTHHIQAASVSVHRIACLIIHKALIWVGWCLAPLYPGISGHLSDRSPLTFPLQAVWWFSLWPVMDPEDAPYSLTGGWGACRGKHVRARAGACREGFCCGGSPVRRGDERCCRPERWSDHWGWRHSAAQDSNSVFFSVFFFLYVSNGLVFLQTLLQVSTLLFVWMSLFFKNRIHSSIICILN